MVLFSFFLLIFFMHCFVVCLVVLFAGGCGIALVCWLVLVVCGGLLSFALLWVVCFVHVFGFSGWVVAISYVCWLYFEFWLLSLFF